MKLVRMILPLSLLAICGFAQDVRYNFDKNADFAKFRTYKWVQLKGAPQMDNLTDTALRTAIEAELTKKGLVKSEGEDADVWIAYQVTLSQEKEFDSYSSDFGYGAGWGRGWYGGGMGSTMSSTTTSTIHVGEVGFDMYDPATKKLVWRGTATKTLDAKAKPDKRQKNINKGVQKLLKNYPPKVKS
jgi:hypothetical protein